VVKGRDKSRPPVVLAALETAVHRANSLIALAALALCLQAAPQAAHAQRTEKINRISVLTGVPLSTDARRIETFHRAMLDLGYVEGKNIAIEWRSTEGHRDRTPALAAELVHDGVDVIVAVGSADIRAARQATSTIPIVMVVGGDVVASGFVASLARPGGNVTGLATFRPELSAKRIALLKEAVPGIRRVAVFSTPIMSDYTQIQEQIRSTAKRLGVTVQYLNVLHPEDIKTAFRTAVAERADAILFEVANPIFAAQRKQVAQLGLRNRLPMIYEREVDAKAGGLMSYGVDRADLYRRAAGYVDKILNGTKPSEIPVEQPTKFLMVVNAKTARSLGITVPRSILARADEVIQ
jgi:ABC-type uncharacterized transport system substrate-binding protein